jgi:phospholipid/cholesterol/gamma-HCH transport system substrate-binding protein
MNHSRTEWKVGLFVIICLVMLGGLLLNFEKGFTVFKKTYEVRLLTGNVGGIKPKAAVLMAGVPIGTVRQIELSEEGKSVIIFLKIFERYPIHADAVFTIEAAGFLGDQYVSILPDRNAGPLLREGDTVRCREPFNMQEAARSALGLIQRVDLTVQQIHETVLRIDRTVLAESTLTNLVATLENLKRVSDQAKTIADRATLFTDKANATMDRVDGLVESNSLPIHATVTNLVLFSKQLNQVGTDLHETVVTNRTQLSAAIRNIETSTILVTNLLEDLHSGKGLAGSLLKSEKLDAQFADLVLNLNTLSSNFVTLSSNLNRFGLLYKPKQVKTNVSSKVVYRGKPLN